MWPCAFISSEITLAAILLFRPFALKKWVAFSSSEPTSRSSKSASGTDQRDYRDNEVKDEGVGGKIEKIEPQSRPFLQ